MNIQDALKQEPQHIQNSPVVQAMAQLIQRQAERISTLEKTIEDLKDEISRLNNTPKRPKFKPNKMEPRNRRKSDSQENFSKNDRNSCALDKKREEIKVLAKEV